MTLAGAFLYDRTKKLVDFWMPRQMISNDIYDKVFERIDEKTKMMA